MKKYLSVREYADKEKITPQGVYKRIKYGNVESIKIGSITLVINKEAK